VFIWFINHSIVLQLGRSFQEHLSPHLNLWRLWTFGGCEAIVLAPKPFSTFTMIGPWCRLRLKMLLITFLKLLFLENCVMLGSFGEHCPLYQVVWWCSFFSLLLAWATYEASHHCWVIFKHKARWSLKRSLICFGPLSNSPKYHHVGPQLHLSIP
jgi:hypothetical protein